jgi:hypothetical protein
MHGRALDTSDLPGGGFDHFRLKAMRFRPAQIHAQQHLAPILCLRSAGARLNIDVRVIRVHLTREHAAELEAGDNLLKPVEIINDFADCGVVIFFDGHIKEFAGIGQTGRNLVESCDYLLECCALLPKGLGALGLIPDTRLFEFALDFSQSLSLALVVKDTSSTHQSVRRGRQSIV